MTMQMSVFMVMSVQCLQKWARIQRQMSKIINGKYTRDSVCRVKLEKEASCHMLVSPLCLQTVAAYFTFLSVLIF